MADAAEVAEWMVEQLEEQSLLYQEIVVYQIAQRFGDEFVYINENGNYGIEPKGSRRVQEADAGCRVGAWRATLAEAPQRRS